MFRLCLGIYFVGGFVVSLVSLLVPRLKLLMGLSYTQASLVQLAFHSSILFFALPITGGWCASATCAPAPPGRR